MKPSIGAEGIARPVRAKAWKNNLQTRVVVWRPVRSARRLLLPRRRRSGRSAGHRCRSIDCVVERQQRLCAVSERGSRTSPPRVSRRSRRARVSRRCPLAAALAGRNARFVGIELALINGAASASRLNRSRSRPSGRDAQAEFGRVQFLDCPAPWRCGGTAQRASPTPCRPRREIPATRPPRRG